MLKSSILPTVILPLLLLTGCATERNKMSTGRVASPNVREISAHLRPSGSIKGSSELNTFEFLGMRFTSGQSRKVGAIGNGLDIQNESASLNPLTWLFDSPASIREAVDSAYYDAVDRSNADGIISTRVKADKTGFSFLHIIGWGTATAEVKGRGVKIYEGHGHR
jgi:hypothetical protein